jgi:hypothetical protein
LSIGEQWLATLIKRHPGIKLPRIMTIWHVVLELAKPAIERLNLRLLLPDEIEGLICQLCERNNKLLSANVSITADIRSLQETILELRLTELTSAEIDHASFDTKEKGKLIRTLLEAYEGELSQHHMADPARILVLARDRLLDGSPCPFILLIPDNLHFAGLLQSLVDQIPEENRCAISTAGLVLPLFGDGRASSPTTILRALDPRFEVRAVMGTLLREKVPIDHAEVLYTGADFYPQLFLDTLQTTGGTAHPLVPCTFGGGVPVSWTRPGKALRLWLVWLKSNYRSQEFFELITQQLLRWPAPLSSPHCLQYLQSLSPCTGRESWKTRLRLRSQSPSVTKEDREVWLRIKVHLDDLFALVPEKEELTANEGWRAAETFLKVFCAVQNDWDLAAQERGLQLIGHLKAKTAGSAERVWDRLQSCIEDDALPEETPRPGCLHLSPLATGGHSGRPWTFIIGMTDEAFPALSSRPSLLSDRERRRLSPELAGQTRKFLLNRQEEDFDQMLHRLTGEIVFTYPCAEQVEGSELFPNHKLLQVFRRQSNQPQSDLHAFEKSLPPPIGPESPLVHLTTEEQWLSSQRDEIGPGDKGTKQGEGILDALGPFPNLVRGAKAIQQREQFLFTPFDGWVPAIGAEIAANLAAHPFSVHALQTLATCPLQFYYRSVLQLTPQSERPTNPDEWLTPLLRGQILHQVFHDYHVHLQRENRRPIVPDDEALLDAILETNLQRHAHLLPAVSEPIKKIEKAHLNETLQIFLKEEAILAPTHRPEFLEVALGFAKEGQPASAIETDQSIPLRLPSGRTIYLRGRVDRIDRLITTPDSPLTTHSYFVWDYKTGGTDDYVDEGQLRSGRLLQPLLYLMMVEQRLRETIDPQAVVEGVGFFFPGTRGLGDRLQWTREELRQHLKVLDRILDVVEKGTFLATDDRDVCERCDYRHACDLRRVHGESRFKLGFKANESLDSLRVLRGEATTSDSTHGGEEEGTEKVEKPRVR